MDIAVPEDAVKITQKFHNGKSANMHLFLCPYHVEINWYYRIFLRIRIEIT
jgi:hypothetical protein